MCFGRGRANSGFLSIRLSLVYRIYFFQWSGQVRSRHLDYSKVDVYYSLHHAVYTVYRTQNHKAQERCLYNKKAPSECHMIRLCSCNS